MLRFGNSIFEPLWNRNHIEYVEITAAESIGIEGRGAFYEQTGVVRDIIQNHLLQVHVARDDGGAGVVRARRHPRREIAGAALGPRR